jgi:hypothetical protein
LAFPKSHGTYLWGASQHTISPNKISLQIGVFQQNIPVLDHTLDLPPHGQEDQDQPVHDKDGPEDRQVEDLAPAAGESNADGAGRRVPELKLGKAADERLELLVALGGERRCTRRHAVFHVRVRLEAGVEFGRDEGQEEVEEVDAERVGDCCVGELAWLFLHLLSFSLPDRASSNLVGFSTLDVPIYHPCANTIRRPNRMKTVAVAIHR